MAVSDSLASVAAALQMPGRPTVSAGEQPAAGTAACSLRERLFDECAGLMLTGIEPANSSTRVEESGLFRSNSGQLS